MTRGTSEGFMGSAVRWLDVPGMDWAPGTAGWWAAKWALELGSRRV